MASQSLRDIWAYMPGPAQSLAILIGFAEVSVFGLAAFANPHEFANGFGVPFTSPVATHPGALETTIDDDSDNTQNAVAVQRTQHGLVAAIAARNIQNGVLLLTFACFVRDRRALGIVFASGLLTTTMDTLIVRAYGEQKMIWGHVFGMVSCIVGGWALLH